MRRDWVVRIIVELDHPWMQGTMLENLRYAGVLVVHRTPTEFSPGVMDVCPPGTIAVKDTPAWAQRNAERMQSFGLNAVAAPRWEKVL